jgi:GTP-binding protein EngB required for normal cell division
MKTKTDKINDLGEEKALVVTQSKGKCQNCSKIGHMAAQCKSKQTSEERNENICNHYKNPRKVKSNGFK